jgi:hypothetical protein
MSQTAPEPLPLTCPQCHMSSGLPFSVTTLAETMFAIRLSIRCNDCKHEWCAEQPSRDLSARERRIRTPQ